MQGSCILPAILTSPVICKWIFFWGVYGRVETLFKNLLYSKALSRYVLEYLQRTFVYQQPVFYTPPQPFEALQSQRFYGRTRFTIYSLWDLLLSHKSALVTLFPRFKNSPPQVVSGRKPAHYHSNRSLYPSVPVPAHLSMHSTVPLAHV